MFERNCVQEKQPLTWLMSVIFLCLVVVSYSNDTETVNEIVLEIALSPRSLKKLGELYLIFHNVLSISHAACAAVMSLLNCAVNSTGLVIPLIVRSAVMRNSRGFAVGSALVNVNVAVGWLVTSKKSSFLRWFIKFSLLLFFQFCHVDNKYSCCRNTISQCYCSFGKRNCSFISTHNFCSFSSKDWLVNDQWSLEFSTKIDQCVSSCCWFWLCSVLCFRYDCVRSNDCLCVWCCWLLWCLLCSKASAQCYQKNRQ